MLKSLKQLIDLRLGPNIALEEIIIEQTYFIKLKTSELLRAAGFLKHDPDTSLALFHQIIFIPAPIFDWKSTLNKSVISGNLLYQFKSLKLPYEVTLVIETLLDDDQIPSLSGLYFGARYFEVDISKKAGLQFESSHRNFLAKRGISIW